MCSVYTEIYIYMCSVYTVIYICSVYTVIYGVPYRLYITAQKYRFLPCRVTARTKNIY